MKIKDLKDAILDIPDDIEVMITNVVNPCGNISMLGKVEQSTYGFFGESILCIILTSEILIDDED